MKDFQLIVSTRRLGAIGVFEWRRIVSSAETLESAKETARKLLSTAFEVHAIITEKEYFEHFAQNAIVGY